MIKLLAIICVLGIVWLGMMYLLFRRNTERKRRKQQGQDPLPGLHISLWHWLQGDSAASATPVMSSAAIPEPDLDQLFDEFTEVDRAILTSSGEEQEQVIMLPYTAPETDDIPASELKKTEPPPVELTSDAIELLRVWRDSATGALVLEIDDQQFMSLDDLRGHPLERRFLNVMRDLNNMARSRSKRPPRQPTAPPTPPPVATPPVPSPTEQKPPARSALQDNEMPSMSPGSMFRQMSLSAVGRKPETNEEETPIMLSIPEQIELVLQARLATLPAYQGRSIHVIPAPGGGVRIEVDDIYYDGVDSVAEDDVRQLLIDVVREWEESQ